MPEAKRFVYILKSISVPHEHYVGVTSSPKAKLAAHNEGLSPHTSEHRPWRILVVIEFDEEVFGKIQFDEDTAFHPESTICAQQDREAPEQQRGMPASALRRPPPASDRSWTRAARLLVAGS